MKINIFQYFNNKNISNETNCFEANCWNFVFLWFIPVSKAQNAEPINVVTTAVPFLRISPDARAGGMGDIGVATSPDARAGFWNIGKVAFNESKGGIAATYTPWLKNLVMMFISLHYQVIINWMKLQAVNVGLRYFSLGNIQFTDQNGNLNGYWKTTRIWS